MPAPWQLDRPPIRWTITTMPQRRDRADYIAQMVPDALVVCRPDLRPAAGTRAAWLAALESPCPWVGVLQDDIVLADDFARKADERIREAQRLGHRAVTFFGTRKQDAEAQRRMERWRAMPHGTFLMHQAVALTREVAEDFLAWCARDRIRLAALDPEDKWDDVVLQAYLKSAGVKMHVCIPNLVDHDVEEPSLLGHPPATGGRPRTSKTFRHDAA